MYWSSKAWEVFRAAHVRSLKMQNTMVRRSAAICNYSINPVANLTFSLPVVHGASLTTKPLDGPR